MAMSPIKNKFRLGVAIWGFLIGCLLASSAQADCKGMVLHAHRGDAAWPENSKSAIHSAMHGDWDGVEIDLQQLRDRQWAINHDPVLGRTTSLAGRTAGDLDSAAWREIRLKDRQGRVTSEPAALLREVLQSIQGGGAAAKVVNAEIKQVFTSCDVAHSAVATMNQGRPSGQWFLTSISRQHLQCARQVDRNGYLGLIVLDPQAMAMQDQRGTRLAKYVAPPRFNQDWLRRLLAEVGAPAGIHIDTHTLLSNPNLLPQARALNIPVFTYNLAGDGEHVAALRQAERQTGILPSGAIIDGQPSNFCEQLGRR